jgi:hypothetical protein
MRPTPVTVSLLLDLKLADWCRKPKTLPMDSLLQSESAKLCDKLLLFLTISCELLQVKRGSEFSVTSLYFPWRFDFILSISKSFKHTPTHTQNEKRSHFVQLSE